MCFLSGTCEGKAHDKSLADLAGYSLPYESCLYQDMGFQGFTLEGITIVQPKKKPPISSIRIRIEHAIVGAKRYRIVKDKLHLLKDGIRDTIMEICYGLHNFRLWYRLWNYTN
jgi:hypothetical protein